MATKSNIGAYLGARPDDFGARGGGGRGGWLVGWLAGGSWKDPGP